MIATSVRYGFSQRFPFPRDRVFAWATDYDPGDLARMGLTGRRGIRRLTDDAFVLTDTYETPAGAVRKQRLVRLFADRYAWTNTHLSGPNRHSQFLYELAAEGAEASRLDFTGLALVYAEAALGPREVAALARQAARDDAAVWKRLARALARDLRGG
jgi:hypothetical protein